jgi:PAS domain S-box-containing protein
MTRLIALLILLMVACTAFAAQDESPLRLGVLAYRPKPQTTAQWKPVATYLQSALKRPVELTAYDHAELTAAAARRAVDVVITTPNHFILLQQTTGLSAPLATLISREGTHELSRYGGVIFIRADRSDIKSLADLSGKRIAAVSTDAFGGYQMQALEMVEAGVPLPKGDLVVITGQPQDRVVEAVLTGRAEAGFVRAGLIESLANEGKLDPGRVKVINRQNLPAFPFAVSTRLYPEWPVAVMPQVDKELARRLAAALFLLPHGSFRGPAAAIHGFDIPANYDDVENLLRRLRLPPFDRPPEITLADLWRRYAKWIATLAGLLLLLAGTSAGLVVMYQRSRQSLREVALLAEKEKLLLASLAEGVYGVDTQGNCIFVNPRALDMLGFSEEELIGKGSHPLFHVKREGSPCTEERCPVDLTLGDGMKRQIEDAFIRKDSTLFPVSLTVSAMRHNSAVVGAVVVFQDITERKRAEESLAKSEARFRRLAENARDVIYRMSLPDGAYEYVSPAATELCGYAPEEFYRNPQLLREFIHPEWRGYIEEEWSRLLRGEIPPTYEFQIIHRSGDVRWVNQRNILVRDDNGRFVAIEGIVTDVTESKKTEEELRNLNEELSGLNEELDQRVRERTTELERKNADLEKMNKVFVGRELRMIELKERIRELERHDRPHGEKGEGQDE